MKVKEIQLKEFKRFTDLTIKNLPKSAKLVVLIGPNGCGKSSIFDAFLAKKTSYQIGSSWHIDEHTKSYYWKSLEKTTSPTPKSSWDLANRNIKIDFHSPPPENQKKSIYIRSAYRNEADFQISSLQTVSPVLDERRLGKMIQSDVAVSQNYHRLCSNALENVFEKEDVNTTIGEFRNKVLEKITESMKRLFDNPTLILKTLGNPLEDKTFHFDKGDSAKFPYQNLSAGEKAAFDLLLDMFVKTEEFNDTVFCIDEPETHISTKLQGKLLKELFILIPENSQIWIATHSIGMMKKAYDLWKANNDSVVFLDFDQNFDKTQTLTPIKPTRTFWQKTYDIALGDLANLVAPKTIVLCEGNPNEAEKGFDAKCYNQIFEEQYPDTLFISSGGHTEIENNDNLAVTIKAITKGVKVFRLIDRDDSTSEAIEENEKQGIITLQKRNIESYLLDDEVLKALCVEENQKDKIQYLLSQKKAIVKKSTTDDLKKSAGFIYNKVKEILSLTQSGKNHKDFMKHTLAPLITKEMKIYKELEKNLSVIFKNTL